MSSNDNESSPIYYRIYLDRDGDVCIVCMQWFDEHDYDQNRFLSKTQFDSEDDAINFLRDTDKELPDSIRTAIDKFLAECPANIMDILD